MKTKMNSNDRENLFKSVNSKEEFVNELTSKGIKESSAVIYWYVLCKKHGVVNNAKRGRKPSTINYKVEYEKLVEKIQLEEVKAKQNKKSTTVFKSLLENVVIA